MYISDILSNDYKNWKAGDKVILSSPPGSGKSTFIMDMLYPYMLSCGARILYLTNRTPLKHQLLNKLCSKLEIPSEYFYNEPIAELPGITFMNYQTVEKILETNELSATLSGYSVVVFDEISYLSTDSLFNANTVFILRWIKKLRQSLQIFLSATIDSCRSYLFEDLTDCIPYRPNDFTRIYPSTTSNFATLTCNAYPKIFEYTMPTKPLKFCVYVYDSTEELVEIVNNDNSDSKWLIFQSNIKKGKDILLAKIKHTASLVTADDKSSNTMQSIVQNEKFNEKVLIATKVLDVGTSLNDPSITNIVMNANNRFDFIQMLGRRRVQKGESSILNLYLPRRSAKYFRTLRHTKILPALEFLKLSSGEILSKFLSDSNFYIRFKDLCWNKDGKIFTNPIAKQELLQQDLLFSSFEQGLTDNPDYFVKKQLEWLSDHDIVNLTFYSVEKKQKAFPELISLLDKYKTLELDADDQDVFKKNIFPLLKCLKPEFFPHKNRIPGMDKINRVLLALGIKCKVESTVKGGKTIWFLKVIT